MKTIQIFKVFTTNTEQIISLCENDSSIDMIFHSPRGKPYFMVFIPKNKPEILVYIKNYCDFISTYDETDKLYTVEMYTSEMNFMRKIEDGFHVIDQNGLVFETFQ